MQTTECSHTKDSKEELDYFSGDFLTVDQDIYFKLVSFFSMKPVFNVHISSQKGVFVAVLRCCCKILQLLKQAFGLSIVFVHIHKRHQGERGDPLLIFLLIFPP